MESASSNPGPSHHQAAVLLVLRVCRDSSFEVLACQNEVYNFLRNDKRSSRLSAEEYFSQPPFSPVASAVRDGNSSGVDSRVFSGVILNRWPGEWRFPGGRQGSGDTSPIDTCLRKLKEIVPELRVPLEPEIKLTLLRKTVVRSHASRDQAQAKVFHVYTFVAFVHENPFLANIDTAAVNRRLARRREKYFRHVERERSEILQLLDRGGLPLHSNNHRSSVPTGTGERQHPPSLVIHQISWLPVKQLLQINSPTNIAVNCWQYLQFQKYGIERRQIEPETENVLQDILNAGTPEVLRRSSVEHTIRGIAAAKSMSERSISMAMFTHGLDSVDLFDLNLMRLLSMNLNILAPGVGLVASEAMAGNSQRKERIDEFVAHIEDRSRAGRPYDVLALQEVFATPFGIRQFCSQTYLRERLFEIGFVHSVVAEPPSIRQTFCQGKWTDSGLLIASKHPIETRRSTVFRSGAADMDAGALKGVLFAQIRFGQRPFLVFNTHLQASHGSDPKWGRIRRRQLQELKQFVVSATRSRPGFPYVLCGDFNVDAIPSDSRDVFFGGGFYDFDSAADDSDEYLAMRNILSPDGSLLDLLKARYGRHPSTRPPRRSFPKKVEYIGYHKYPQRLDYVFFVPGSLGQFAALPQKTEIKPFVRGHRISKQSSSGDGADDTNDFSHIPGTSFELESKGDKLRSQLDPQLSSDGPTTLVHSGNTVSDHFGISAEFHCENAFSISWSSTGLETRSATDSSAEAEVDPTTQVNLIARAATQSMRSYRVLPFLLWFARPILVVLVMLEVFLSFQLRVWTGLDDSDFSLHACVENGTGSQEDGPINCELDSRSQHESESFWTWQLIRLIVMIVCAALELAREVLIGWWRRLFDWWRLGSMFRVACGHSGALGRGRSRWARFWLQVLFWLPLPLCGLCAANRIGRFPRGFPHRSRRALRRFTRLVKGSGWASVVDNPEQSIRRNSRNLVGGNRFFESDDEDSDFGIDEDSGVGSFRSPRGSLEILPFLSNSPLIAGLSETSGPGSSRWVESDDEELDIDFISEDDDSALSDEEEEAGEWIMHQRRLRSALGVGQQKELVVRDSLCPDVSTLHELFLYSVDHFGHRECAGSRVRLPDGSPGPYDFLSYQQIFHRVTWFGDGLVRLVDSLNTSLLSRSQSLKAFKSEGSATGDSVEPLSSQAPFPAENRVEWMIADLACFAQSLVSIPLSASNEDDLKQLIEHSQIEVLVCSRRWTLRVLKCLTRGSCRKLKIIVQMERMQYEEIEAAAQVSAGISSSLPESGGLPPNTLALHDFNYVEQKGQRHPISRPRRPLSTDIATVTYAPRGQPTEPLKGHVLTHGNMISQLAALHQGLNLNEHDVHFSFTPLVHLAERVVLLYAIKCGMAIGFYQGAMGGSIFACMELLKPTFVVGSVSIFRQLYHRFQRSAQRWTSLYKTFFRVAYSRKQQLFARGQYTSLLWDWLVFRGIARLMGGNLRCILVELPQSLVAPPRNLASLDLDPTTAAMHPRGVDEEDETARVFQFLSTCFCCPVLHGSVRPEAAGFFTLGTLESPALDSKESHTAGTTVEIGFGMPCNQLQLLPLTPSTALPLSSAGLGEEDRGEGRDRKDPEESAPASDALAERKWKPWVAGMKDSFRRAEELFRVLLSHKFRQVDQILENLPHDPASWIQIVRSPSRDLQQTSEDTCVAASDPGSIFLGCWSIGFRFQEPGWEEGEEKSPTASNLEFQAVASAPFQEGGISHTLIPLSQRDLWSQTGLLRIRGPNVSPGLWNERNGSGNPNSERRRHPPLDWTSTNCVCRLNPNFSLTLVSTLDYAAVLGFIPQQQLLGLLGTRFQADLLQELRASFRPHNQVLVSQAAAWKYLSSPTGGEPPRSSKPSRLSGVVNLAHLSTFLGRSCDSVRFLRLRVIEPPDKLLESISDKTVLDASTTEEKILTVTKLQGLDNRESLDRDSLVPFVAPLLAEVELDDPSHNIEAAQLRSELQDILKTLDFGFPLRIGEVRIGSAPRGSETVDWSSHLRWMFGWDPIIYD